MSDTVTVEDMRSKLLSLETVTDRLSQTEPVTHVTFAMNSPANVGATFELGETWAAAPVADDEAIDATVRIGPDNYRLSKGALLEFTSSLNITKKYAQKCPAPLLQPHINHWCRSTDREVKALIVPDETGDTAGRVQAFTKASIEPFSNLRLLEQALESITARYGDNAEVLVDYKFVHDFERTRMRLVVPDHVRQIREDDTWSAGVQIANSQIGASPTSLKGYLFRWWCTNGNITTRAESGSWNRRRGGQGDEVYEWARHAVDEILGGLEEEFEAVEIMANTAVREEDLNDVLADVFDRYRVPLQARESVIEEMVNTDDLTMYGVMQAITQAANHVELNGGDLPDHMAERLMAVGGDLPRAYADGTTAFVPTEESQSAIGLEVRQATLELEDGTRVPATARRIRN